MTFFAFSQEKMCTLMLNVIGVDYGYSSSILLLKQQECLIYLHCESFYDVYDYCPDKFWSAFTFTVLINILNTNLDLQLKQISAKNQALFYFNTARFLQVCENTAAVIYFSCRNNRSSFFNTTDCTCKTDYINLRSYTLTFLSQRGERTTAESQNKVKHQSLLTTWAVLLQYILYKFCFSV